ncbi:Spindle-shaped halovirus associated protein [Methanonatronarchaeum thermophilum]|uniref:Spindle-shaped halovirus associated protein n=1 Tax=Methanonatronarchaeum thermophilum TaxID=1927129 RepID=A0A1Y3GAX0_9EURY|nr:hypothetical protein [Methanonatronarchaeum thermophilum]OUJ18601.1 Spindle-shaped halovirus associated protein [Methanonatronarchaeum thermophilum]
MKKHIQKHKKPITTISILTLTILTLITITPTVHCTPIQIGHTTSITDYSYDATDNTFQIEIKTETPTTIKLTDATNIRTGSNDIIYIEEKTFVLEPGKQKINHTVTEHRGEAAIGIQTPTHSLILIEKTGLFEKNPEWMEVRAAGLGGILTGIGVITIIALKKHRKTPKQPERIL